MLAIAVVTGSVWVLLIQVLLFAVGTVRGVQHTPYGFVFRRFVRPSLRPPAELEDPAPPRFAQGVGLVVTGAGVLAAVVGVPGAVEVGAGLALVAALLNCVFGLCLGCELYLLIVRMRATPA